MEERLNPLKNHQISYLEWWLPCLVAISGSFLTIILFYYLLHHNDSQAPLYHILALALPWILLVCGVSIAILCGIIVRLSQINLRRNSALNTIESEFKKEIAERIKAEESKQKLEIALLQGQKLQAIGTLAGGIAHDFNNIIYAIKGYVEMAREDVSQDSLLFKNLGKVLEAAQRGQDLIARILAFGRKHQHHELKPLNLKSILESVLSLLRPTIPTSVTINLLGITKDHMILGDQTQLHQVIVNLINNAVDAMDGEGVITIQISQIPANDDYLRQFPNRKNTDYCKIEISDTGHGMDHATMERIYEPFFTTKEVGKGTGLGLSTVHTIMEDHQGDISVSSRLGHGTTFTLVLPEYKPAINHMENS